MITPASGFVGPVAALIMGLVGGVCCFWGAVVLKRWAGWDDSLDAFGVGGIVGAILTGVFATSAVSWILLKIVDKVIGLRITADDERMGLDLSLHGKRIE